MLELKNVSKYYYNKGLISSGFSKVNLKLDMGEFVAITGNLALVNQLYLMF
jgi:putative ABC transport system permease protein